MLATTRGCLTKDATTFAARGHYIQVYSTRHRWQENSNEWRATLPQTEVVKERHVTPERPPFVSCKTSYFLDKACSQNDSIRPDSAHIESKHTSFFG